MALLDDSDSPRTERPTARRRREARERGLVARSHELLNAARLLVIWLVVAVWIAQFANFAKAWLQHSLQPTQPLSPPSESLGQLREHLWRLLATASWPLWAATAAIVITHFLQVGWIWRWDKVSPQASRLSPFSERNSLWPSAICGRALGLCVKLVLLISVSAMALTSLIGPSLAPRTLSPIAHLTAGAAPLSSHVAVALLAFGLLDYGWRRWRFERSLMMTRDELHEELKDAEGDPQFKQNLRRRVQNT
jgi:flagellar biosynthetic protein FlhB